MTTRSRSRAALASHGWHLWTLAGAVAVLAACGGNSTKPDTRTVTQVTVTFGSINVDVGGTAQATATVKDSAGGAIQGRKIEWQSLDPSLASISATGLISGIKAGTVRIRATVNGVVGEASLRVGAIILATIDSIRPALLVPGQTATIYGSKFGDAIADNVVRIDGVLVQVTGVTPTTLTITVPDLGCAPAKLRTVTIESGGTTAQKTGVTVMSTATPISIPVGGVRILTTPSEMACVLLPATASESEVLFIPANTDRQSDVQMTVRLVFTPGDFQATTTRVLANDDGETRLPRLATAPLLAEAQSDVPAELEQRIRGAERALLNRPGVREAFERQRQPSAGRGVRASVAPAPPPNVGDIIPLRVPDVTKSQNDPCSMFFNIGARVMAVSSRAVIVQDTLAPANGFSTTDYTDIAQEFDQLIYPTNVTFFGDPSDIDTSDRITILYTPRVNSLTPPNNPSGLVGGFFFGGDLVPTTLCQQSNRAEIFYLLVPDPTGAFNNVRTTAQVRQATRGTIAHEFQHMINSGIRIANGFNQETVWLNEGLSHFAEDAVGRVARGFGQFQNLTFDQVFANQDDYRAYFFQNLARFQLWMVKPDTSSPTSFNAGPELSHRGAIQMLLRHAVDHYSRDDPPAFTRLLVRGPLVGVTNLEQASGVPLDSLIAGWLVANYADDLGIPGLATRYTYRSWNIRDAEASRNNGNYPLQINQLIGATSVTTTIRSGTGAYFRYASGATSATQTFRMVTTSDNPVTQTGAMLIVLRVK